MGPERERDGSWGSGSERKPHTSGEWSWAGSVQTTLGMRQVDLGPQLGQRLDVRALLPTAATISFILKNRRIPLGQSLQLLHTSANTGFPFCVNTLKDDSCWMWDMRRAALLCESCGCWTTSHPGGQPATHWPTQLGCSPRASGSPARVGGDLVSGIFKKLKKIKIKHIDLYREVGRCMEKKMCGGLQKE